MEWTTERLEKILDAVTDGYYVLDHEWRFTQVSRAAARHFGRSPDELVGANIWVETGLGPGSLVYDKFHEILATGMPGRFDAESRLQPGEWFELSLVPRQAGVEVFYRRITARKLAQAAATTAAEQRGLALEIANLGTWEFDEAARIVRLDARSAQVLGLSERHDHSLADFLSVVVAEDRDGVRADIERALNPEGAGTYISEHRIQHPDGTLRWVVARGRALRPASPLEGGGQPRLFFGTLMDVTEQRQAGESLRDTSERLRRVVEHIHDALIIDDVAGRIVFANDQFLNLFGFDRDELPGLSLENYVAPEYRQALRERHDRRMRGESVPTHFEYEGLRRSGSRMWLEVDVVPIVDSLGRVTHTQSAIREITDRKKAEDALRESEERFRALFQYSPDAVFLTVPNGRILAANPAACGIFQMTEEEICQGGRDRLADPADPRSRQAEADRRLHGTVASREMTYIRKNGERFPGETTSVILPGEGSRAFVVVRDVTERQRAEEALRKSERMLREQAAELQAVLDALPAAVFITHDADARQMEGNRFAEDLLRVAPHSNLSKSALPPQRPATFKAMRRGVEVPPEELPVQMAVRTGEEVRDYEFDVVYEEGKTASLYGNAAPLLDEHRRVRGAVGAFVDVTRLKQAEDALNRANAELAEADYRKDEFIAILSHELRNPLAPIRYALPVLQRERLTQQAGRAVQVIDRQVDHLTRLVDDLLDVSRITRGKIELRKEHITLGSVINAAVEAASPGITAARHTLELAVSDEPAWLYADAARIAQVVTNLLNNSAKYTPRGGRIWLDAGVDRNQVVVRVRDNGMGIPPHALPSVFEMFRQVSRPDKSQGGLGIGLALVKRLVEMHAGSIEAHSGGPGQGAEFIVRLPLAAEGKLGEQPNYDSARGSAGPKLRVLVVDDNADLVEMLALLVEGAGHEVRKALDGRSALSAALSYRPDVVLLDLGLPVMSGIQVAREIRRHPEMAQVRLVALTGWGQPEDRRQTEEAGFDAHLTKPADAERLQRLLEGFAATPPAGADR